MDAIISLLKNSYLFSSLNEEEIADILSLIQIQRWEADQIILKENETNKALYIIRSGMVYVSKENMGTTIFLCYLGQGTHFGEMSILAHRPICASVTTVETTETIAINKEDFLNLLTNNKSYGVKILHALTTHLIDRLNTLTSDFSTIMGVSTMSQRDIDLLVSTL